MKKKTYQIRSIVIDPLGETTEVFIRMRNLTEGLRSKEQQKGKEIRVEAVLNKNDPRH